MRCGRGRDHGSLPDAAAERLKLRGVRANVLSSVVAASLALAFAMASRPARAQSSQLRQPVPVPMPMRKAPEPLPDEEHEDLRDKTEWAGFPVVGGSTDVGVQFGAAGTVTHVGGGFKPYWWKADALISASVKGGPRGTEIVQQSHDLRMDIPGGANGKARLQPGVFFDRTVNAGYFGLGNATRVVTNPDGTFGSRYQYTHQEFRTRLNIRTPIDGPWSAQYGWQLRYVNPSAYAESRLAIDATTRLSDGRPLVRGLEPLGIGIVNGGLIYDTRDDEIFPRRGSFHLGAIRLAGATPTESGVYWGGANFILRRYVSLGGPFVLAGRIFADFMVGQPPFYDLASAGAFIGIDFPGGPQGIRGVPNGRYSGLIKVVGNVELRATHISFRFIGSKFRLGNTLLVDAGRVWNDYTFSDVRDGTSIGLKYGIGGGAFLIWDTAALFRVDLAYSPDASAANPGFPIGIYVQEAMMF